MLSATKAKKPSNEPKRPVGRLKKEQPAHTTQAPQQALIAHRTHKVHKIAHKTQIQAQIQEKGQTRQ